MSKGHFISTSRFVLSIAAAGIVGFSATHNVQAAELVAVPQESVENKASEPTVANVEATENPDASTAVEASVTETLVAAEEITVEEVAVEEGPVVEAGTETGVEAEAPVEEAPASEAQATERPDEITIAHTNDIHGRAAQEDGGVIGIANAAQYYEEIGADVVVDSGDAFQGLPLSNHDEGAAMAAAMNEAGYDAMAVGNHEFDFGQDVAIGYQDKTGFPVLSVNTVYEDSQELVFEPSTNVEAEGYNLGVVGVTTPETATKTHPNNVENIEFLAPIETTINEISQLLEDDTIIEDAFIVLAHLGVDATTNEEWRATALATALDDVAAFNAYQIIVLDGHSHTAYADQRYGNVLLQQTGTALNNIGLVNLNFADPSLTRGELVTAQTALETLGYEFDEEGNQITEGRTNETVQAIVDEAASIYEAETSREIVEENPIWFNGVREHVRSHETNSGTYITDAMVAYGREGGFVNPTDFAMINGGGIREQIVEGESITEGDVIAVLPFGNIISQIQVTGETIYDMFELAYSATTVTEAYTSSDGRYTVEAIDEDSNLPSLAALGGFLQVSSDIKIYFDPTLETGQRVLGVYTLNRETGEYELVANDATGTYYMATNDFLAQGGDGYTMLSGEREEGPSLDRVVMDAMESGSVDLANYADPLPQNQIIPILTADYQALLAANEVPSEEVPTEETPGQALPEEEVPAKETSEDKPATDKDTPSTGASSTDGQSEPAAMTAGKGNEKASSANGQVDNKVTDKQVAASVSNKTNVAEDEKVVAAATLPETGYAGNLATAFSALFAGFGLLLFPKSKRK